MFNVEQQLLLTQKTFRKYFHALNISSLVFVGLIASSGVQANGIVIGPIIPPPIPLGVGSVGIGILPIFQLPAIVEGSLTLPNTTEGFISLAPPMASGFHSVSIGRNSNDDGRAEVISIGNTTQTRSITHVTAGVNATDAANVGQVQIVQSSVDTLGNAVVANTAQIATNTTAVSLNQAAILVAQTTANTAQTNASNAQTSANTALTNAATVQSSIDHTLSQLASVGVCKPTEGGGLLCGTAKGKDAQSDRQHSNG